MAATMQHLPYTHQYNPLLHPQYNYKQYAAPAKQYAPAYAQLLPQLNEFTLTDLNLVINGVDPVSSKQSAPTRELSAEELDCVIPNNVFNWCKHVCINCTYDHT